MFTQYCNLQFATLVTARWNSSRSKYERNTFRHAAAMSYQIYQGFRISLSPHIPTSQRQSKGRPWIFHILCDCRPSKKGSPHIGAGIPSEISYWTFCGKFTEGYLGPLPFSVLHGIVRYCNAWYFYEVKYLFAAIPYKSSKEYLVPPPLLCQIKLQYFAAKSADSELLPDWVKCHSGHLAKMRKSLNLAMM